jgi:hypothetical protein
MHLCVWNLPSFSHPTPAAQEGSVSELLVRLLLSFTRTVMAQDGLAAEGEVAAEDHWTGLM